MKNILRSLLGDKAYKQLLKLIGNGGGGNTNDGEVKVFKLVYDTKAAISPLWYDEVNNSLIYTAVEFDEYVTEDVKQEALKSIEINKTFANSVLEAINNGEPVCINMIYLDNGITNSYTRQYTFFATYEYSTYIENSAISLFNHDDDTFISIPATLSDDNTKYMLTDYVVHVGNK